MKIVMSRLALSLLIVALGSASQESHSQTSTPLPGFVNLGGGGNLTCDSECSKQILKYSTIAIDTPGSSGSGVIVGHVDGVYTAITAAHVVKGFSAKEELRAVSLPSKNSYRILSVEFPGKGKYDIALVRFKASETLYIQPLNLFITAPPLIPRTNWGIDGGGARSAGISLPSGAVTVPVFRFNEFATQDRAEGNKDGYEFLYNASTVPGMSGGPIIGWRQTCMNSKGMYIGNGYFSLVAIHGRSEGNSAGGRSGLSMGVPLDLIKDELKLKAKEYGIPATDQEVNEVAKKQYCAAFFG